MALKGRKPMRLLIALAFIGISFSAHSSGMISFQKIRTDDGRIIYSNIEKRCFSNGRLICLNYHPIFSGRQPARTRQNANSAGGQLKSSTTTDLPFLGSPPVKKSSSNICHPKGGQYYPMTINNFTPYSSMKECIESGGREAN